MPPLIGGLELGGTKAVVAVAHDPLQPLRHARIPTRRPDETLRDIGDFFAQAADELGSLSALGIASFGPIGIRRGNPQWGRMGSTTKPDWPGADVAGPLGDRLGCPVALDTDVNGAAIAEARWGAGRRLGSVAYLTVGTGIGGGLVIDGRPVHGAMHPEMGHVRLERAPGDEQASVCGFHPDCAEGLASGPAIRARFGCNFDELGPDHPFRAVLADYLGQLCATIALVASPERIVIGGGVMGRANLHADVEAAMGRRLNFYLETSGPNGEAFVVPPGLGDQSGLAGAFALAQDLL